MTVDAGSAKTAELGQALRKLGEREAVLRREAGDAQERYSGIEVEIATLDVSRRDLRAKLGDDANDAGQGVGLTLTKTRFGRRIYLFGENDVALRFSGARTERTIIFTYMMIGIIVGTYSSIFVASPLVHFMDSYLSQRETDKLREARGSEANTARA
mgnify:CR=1 FL=1